MGETRVIYSDATTAEAGTVLKGNGFLESNQGGLFTSHAVPAKVYVVWGRSDYYPELIARLEFAPRIQVHVKARDGAGEMIAEVARATAGGLRALCPGTKLRCFDPADGSEIPC